MRPRSPLAGAYASARLSDAQHCPTDMFFVDDELPATQHACRRSKRRRLRGGVGNARVMVDRHQCVTMHRHRRCGHAHVVFVSGRPEGTTPARSLGGRGCV